MEKAMWNSSRRIALTATAVALTAGGLVGLAWMADWMPIEFGDTPSGEMASDVQLDEIPWNTFESGPPDESGASETSPWSEDVPPDDIFASQSEPVFGEGSLGADSREFVSRADWTTEPGGSPGESPGFSEPPNRATVASIPERFPTIDELRRGSTPASAVGRDGRLNLETQPDQVIQPAAYESEAGAPRSSFAGTTPPGEPARTPRLFDSSEPGTLNQARQFPDGVAVAAGNRAPVFEDPNGPAATAEPPRTDITGGPGPLPETTSIGEVTPAARTGAELDIGEIDAWLREGDYVSAHRDLSKIYWNQPESRRSIQERLDKNAKLIYFSPQPNFLEPYVIQPGDYLQRVAPMYRISWEYLASLNAISPRRIRAGQKLKVIKGPFSAFVDLSDFELTVHCHGFYVKRYDIGIGKDGASPVGRHSVLEKIPRPQWTDPNGRVVAGGDPTNPLGTHWVDIGDGYGIHGTINPRSIGKAESRGCIRMRNEDIKEVYDFLIRGSEVVVRP